MKRCLFSIEIFELLCVVLEQFLRKGLYIISSNGPEAT